MARRLRANAARHSTGRSRITTAFLIAVGASALVARSVGAEADRVNLLRRLDADVSSLESRVENLRLKIRKHSADLDSIDVQLQQLIDTYEMTMNDGTEYVVYKDVDVKEPNWREKMDS